MKCKGRTLLYCLLLLMVVSGVNCCVSGYACRKCRVVVVGNVCDRGTTGHLKGVQIFRRNKFDRERMELVGTQEEERFSVERRLWVCRRVYPVLGGYYGQRPLCARLTFVKDGYLPQDMYIDVFKHAPNKDAEEVSIDLGTVFLDRVSSETGSK